MKIFMVMPFTPHYFNLFEFGYAHVARSLGLEIQTVMDDLQPGPIPDKILKKIAESDIVLVDASELNANVFFEAGYAAGLGKTILYAVEDVAKLPFDTKQDLHMIHAGQVAKIREELPGYLASAVEHAAGANQLANPLMTVHCKGWQERSSRRPGKECSLTPEPAIDPQRTLGHGRAMRIRRAPAGTTPLADAISVVEFCSYAPDERDYLPLAPGALQARCHAFIANAESELEHRWRVLLFRKPGECIGHVWGSPARVPAGEDGWTLVDDRMEVGDVGEATLARFALETTGGAAPTTYWVSRPSVSLS